MDNEEKYYTLKDLEDIVSKLPVPTPPQMKRAVTISAGIEGVIATGSYQNMRPSFYWSETIENCTLTDTEIEARIKELYNKGYNNLKQVEQGAIVDRIQNEKTNRVRFRISPTTGKALPSVTSIINVDADFFVNPVELQQYASQGTITHAIIKEYIKTGEIKNPKDIQEIWTDLLILRDGNLKLPAVIGDFPAFLAKYPILHKTNGTLVYNDNDLYSGEPDFTGIPDSWKDAQNIPTVFDIKRTIDKIKGGMQLAAYAKCLNVKQGALIAINDKTEQGFSKPVIFDEKQLEGYYKLFLRKREDFRKRYNI